MDNVVNLNVGGCLYTTTRSTLTCYPDSMLSVMFTGELNPSVRDANGAYVMDRDGPIFRHVLNFLRQGRLILPEDFKEWDLLASEADFYQVGALVEAVKKEQSQKIQPAEATTLVNVGGCLYTTTRSTLTRYPDTTLAAMFNGELGPSVCDRDANGSYIVDRDGPIFRHVLNFLREGRLILPEDFKEWDQLASEADFYKVKPLEDAVMVERCCRATQDAREKLEVVEINMCGEYLHSYFYMGSSETLIKLPRIFNAIANGHRRGMTNTCRRGAENVKQDISINGMVAGNFHLGTMERRSRSEFYQELFALRFEPRGLHLQSPCLAKVQTQTFYRKIKS